MDDWRLALLNRWQHGFPLEREPYAEIGDALGLPQATVIEGLRELQANGALSRIGGVFGTGTGGAALLAAMAVPIERMEAVAAIVSAHPGVNHNYERENRHNLWFVMTGRDAESVESGMQALELATGLPALRLRMERAYRIDLGFDMRHGQVSPAARRSAGLGPGHTPAAPVIPPPVADGDWALAALVEDGLPLIQRPFDAWGEALGCTPQAVIARLQQWLRSGTLKRFGTVVRHHELGYTANAMTVFDVPDALVDGCGAALAHAPGVTLCYRRERAPGWPYNLYCMVHGRDRASVRAALDAAIPACGLEEHPRAVLFSRRRFKQTGARRFRDLPVAQTEALHVLA